MNWTTDHDIAQVLPRAKLSASGWWVTECPFCASVLGTPGRGRKLGIRDDTGAYHCFRCHTVGRLRAADARTLKSMAAGAPVKAIDRTEATRPPEGFYEVADDDSLSLAEAREYLYTKRGLRPDVVRAARIGACVRGKYAGRVVVPVLTAVEGVWSGFVARTWGPKHLCDVPYLYPPGMDREHVLYNAGALDVVTEEPAIAVEGAFDTMPYYPDGVGLFGDASEGQIDALSIARRPVCIVLDGDAWRKGLMLALRLRFEGQRAGAVRLPPKKDPDELPPALVREAAWQSIEEPGALVCL